MLGGVHDIIAPRQLQPITSDSEQVRPLAVPNVGLFPEGDVGASDLEVFQAMRSGLIDPGQGLRRVAQSGGWPIDTGEGFIVAHLSPSGGFAVASDAEGWSVRPMERAGDLHFAEIKSRSGAPYKMIHDGVWFADPMARRYTYDAGGEISLSRSPGAHLERWPMMTDGGLIPRTVRVWIPKRSPTHHLYVQDGQNLFDPKAMHGGWQLQRQVADTTMVVGIDAGDRFAEYTHTFDEGVEPKGDQYADFVRHHVRPRMQQAYGAPRRVGVMGSSLGGLISFHMAHRHPNDYDFVGSLSGTFGWGTRTPEGSGDTMMKRYEGQRFRRPKFYLDSGGNPQGGDNYDHNIEMAEVLERAGYRWGKELWHWHERGAPHREYAWRDRVFRPLAIFEGM